MKPCLLSFSHFFKICACLWVHQNDFPPTKSSRSGCSSMGLNNRSLWVVPALVLGHILKKVQKQAAFARHRRPAAIGCIFVRPRTRSSALARPVLLRSIYAAKFSSYSESPFFKVVVAAGTVFRRPPRRGTTMGQLCTQQCSPFLARRFHHSSASTFRSRNGTISTDLWVL